VTVAELKKYRVPKTAITERGLKKLIRDAAKDHSSVGDWAISNGVTAQTVSAFMRKVQGPGLKLPEVLGYRPQVVYLPLEEGLIQEPAAPRRPTDRPTKKVDHSKDTVEKNTVKKKDDREETKKRLKKKKRR
jgi:hypothetical protein